MSAVLTGLNVYPLKGGGGTTLASAELEPKGLRYDREFMLVTPEGRFLSQRDLTRMALIRPSYDGEVLTVEVADPAPATTPLVHKATADGPVREVYVHRSQCEGVDQGDEAADWFSALLETECRLVRFTGHRATGRGGGEVAFADAYPLLLISEESLDDLNGRLARSGAGPRQGVGENTPGAGPRQGSGENTPLPMNRFRPNLVVSGLGAFGEDSVRLLRVGETVVELVKACARCVVTTTDQDTGERGREPLRTLASYRTIGRGIRFGQNGVPRTLGTVRVGDPVEILETR